MFSILWSCFTVIEMMIYLIPIIPFYFKSKYDLESMGNVIEAHVLWQFMRSRSLRTVQKPAEGALPAFLRMHPYLWYSPVDRICICNICLDIIPPPYICTHQPLSQMQQYLHYLPAYHYYREPLCTIKGPICFKDRVHHHSNGLLKQFSIFLHRFGSNIGDCK